MHDETASAASGLVVPFIRKAAPRTTRPVVAAKVARDMRRQWFSGTEDFERTVSDALDALAADALDDVFDGLRSDHGEVVASMMLKDTMAIAQSIDAGGETTELFFAGVVVRGALPDAVSFAGGLPGCGAFGPEGNVRFHPEWFPMSDVVHLAPVELRGLLVDLVSGRSPKVRSPSVASGDYADVFLLPGTASTTTGEDAVPGSSIGSARSRSVSDGWLHSLSENFDGISLVLHPVRPAEIFDELDVAVGGSTAESLSAVFGFLVSSVEKSALEFGSPACVLTVLGQELHASIREESSASPGREASIVVPVVGLPSMRSVLDALRKVCGDVSFEGSAHEPNRKERLGLRMIPGGLSDAENGSRHV